MPNDINSIEDEFSNPVEEILRLEGEVVALRAVICVLVARVAADTPGFDPVAFAENLESIGKQDDAKVEDEWARQFRYEGLTRCLGRITSSLDPLVVSGQSRPWY